jgi:uncharacterized membrane protein YgdD (TMEM256/DUF423 family)
MRFDGSQLWLFCGALLGCLAVICGAFGAHGLERLFESQQQLGEWSPSDVARKLANWETAARYQMYHALALLVVGWMARQRSGWAFHLAGAAFVIGVLIFSGSLYALVLTGITGLGAIVPIGGVLLVVGWICLGIAAWRSAP